MIEKELAAEEWKREQASKDLSWLRTEHAEVELAFAVLKKEHEKLTKDVWNRKNRCGQHEGAASREG
jgi:hypothetical protein